MLNNNASADQCHDDQKRAWVVTEKVFCLIQHPNHVFQRNGGVDLKPVVLSPHVWRGQRSPNAGQPPAFLDDVACRVNSGKMEVLDAGINVVAPQNALGRVVLTKGRVVVGHLTAGIIWIPMRAVGNIPNNALCLEDVPLRNVDVNHDGVIVDRIGVVVSSKIGVVLISGFVCQIDFRVVSAFIQLFCKGEQTRETPIGSAVSSVRNDHKLHCLLRIGYRV